MSRSIALEVRSRNSDRSAEDRRVFRQRSKRMAADLAALPVGSPEWAALHSQQTAYFKAWGRRLASFPTFEQWRATVS